MPVVRLLSCCVLGDFEIHYILRITRQYRGKKLLVSNPTRPLSVRPSRAGGGKGFGGQSRSRARSIVRHCSLRVSTAEPTIQSCLACRYCSTCVINVLAWKCCEQQSCRHTCAATTVLKYALLCCRPLAAYTGISFTVLDKPIFECRSACIICRNL